MIYVEKFSIVFNTLKLAIWKSFSETQGWPKHRPQGGFIGKSFKSQEDFSNSEGDIMATGRQIFALFILYLAFLRLNPV